MLYAMCVYMEERKKGDGGDTTEDNIRGPFPTPTFDFDPEHPLAESHVQRLRFYTFKVPIISEKPPPAPKPDATDTNSPAHRRFAEWYGSLLWPWAASGDDKGTAEVFTWDALVEARMLYSVCTTRSISPLCLMISIARLCAIFMFGYGVPPIDIHRPSLRSLEHGTHSVFIVCVRRGR